MNILVVEDDPNLRLLWRAVLEDRNHIVLDAPNVAQAHRLLNTRPVDLIVLDLYLGSDLGLSLATSAAELGSDIKVVLVTGSARHDRDELFDHSPVIAEVLRKPVDIETLAATCEGLLSGQYDAARRSDRSA